MADSIRMAKIMKGMTGAGAGKAVTDEDIANNRRMMAERGMSDMEKSNATTDMDAEKAGMIKKLMMMMGGSKGRAGKGMMGGGMVKKYKGGGSVKGGFPDLTGDGKVTQKDILKGRGVKRHDGRWFSEEVQGRRLRNARSWKKSSNEQVKD